ncbi:DNA primase, partial [Candidatus Saccharibacteria bacterium]
MMEAKEEVRSRLNIEDVVGEYVQLKRAGRNFKGLSPFTSERTPSFIVSPDKQIWHDFSSNKGGDVFSFVMEVEGIDFRAALELLARKAGVDLSQYQTSGNRSVAKKKERLLSVLDLAATYYQQSLLKNQNALAYIFKKRGFSKEVVQLFRLGYAPMADDALVRALAKRGYTQDEMKDAGLAVQRRGRMGD